MEEQEPRGFKIDFSNDAADLPGKKSSPQPGKKPKPPAAPGIRAGILSLLLFCVLGGLLFFGYFHLNERISRVEELQTRGADQFGETVSKEIDKRFSALTELVSEPTQQIKARVLEVEKQVKNQTSSISGLTKDIADARQSMQNGLSEVEKRLSSRITEVTSEVSTLKSRLNADFHATWENVAVLEKRLGQMRDLASGMDETDKQIEALGKRLGHLDKELSQVHAEIQTGRDDKEVQQQITRLEETIDQQLTETADGLQKRIRATEDQLQSLEAIVRSLENMQNRSPSRESGEKTGSAAGGTGRIIEQEIQ